MKKENHLLKLLKIKKKDEENSAYEIGKRQFLINKFSTQAETQHLKRFYI